MYICRFVDPSLGFACGWEYAISWLTVLPFEISAACNIIHYWPGSEGINNAAWIVPLLVALVVIQFFGVKGYGEVEFVISTIKVLACTGFIILGIIIDCGGVKTDTLNRGYIGVMYWYDRHIVKAGDLQQLTIWTQESTVHGLPQWLPRLLRRLRHRRLRLHRNRAGRTRCRRDPRPTQADPESLEAGRLAYLHLLHCQSLPRRPDRACQQSLVLCRGLLIAPLTFCHCHSAGRHQSTPFNLQRRHFDRRHERCKLLHIWLDSDNSGAGREW